MKTDGLLKHVAITLAASVIFYIVCFAWIEHRREFKGPWEITFQTDSLGVPTLLIAEPALNISKKISFPNEKTSSANLSQTVRFDQPVTALPFGLLLFQDPTFLPGTLTINLFRHEIELLPRVLNVDKKEISWQSGSDVSITEPGQIEPKPANQHR